MTEETTVLMVDDNRAIADTYRAFLDDEQVLLDVPFRAVSEYMTLPSGTRTVQITAASDADTVVFDGAATSGSPDGGPPMDPSVPGRSERSRRRKRYVGRSLRGCSPTGSAPAR